MKRYLLFAHPELYPKGGLFDAVGFYDLYEAKECGESHERNGSVNLAVYILDTINMLVIVLDFEENWVIKTYDNFMMREEEREEKYEIQKQLN